MLERLGSEQQVARLEELARTLVEGGARHDRSDWRDAAT
jgi:hypothetical protein